MMLLNSFFPLFLFLGGGLINSSNVSLAKSLAGSRVLVVLEDANQSLKFSKLFGDLQSRGYHLRSQSPRNETLSLFEFGERAFDHVIIFPPVSKGYGPALTPKKLIELSQRDGNIMLLTSPTSTPEQAREFARELEIELPARDYVAVDHLNYDTISQPEKHDMVLIPRPPRSNTIQNYFTKKTGAGDESGLIVFHGAGHTLGNRPMLFPILTASRSAYTYDSREESAFAEDATAAGTQMHYVTAFQSRNNARITICGSTDMFTDDFFAMQVMGPEGKKKTATANRAFAKDITQWTFKETGIVKVVAIRHFLSDQENPKINPRIYRIKNDVTFEIELSEWAVDHWKPFIVPEKDSIQLELTMLDPYYRLSLRPATINKKSRVYSTSFRLPDQHGIFAFNVIYKRPFVTFLNEKYTVTVRHFAHDEYTRSWDISGAWVWIAGIAVTIAAWIVFCGLWLYSAPPEKSRKKTQ